MNFSAHFKNREGIPSYAPGSGAISAVLNRPRGHGSFWWVVPACAAAALGSGGAAAQAPQISAATAQQQPISLESTEYGANNRTEVMHHKVTGIGAASSFYDPGNHVFHESEMRYNRTTSAWRSTLNGTVRYTDSKQFDINYWSVQNFAWKVSDTRREFSAGDYFANMSQYSMSKSIKGVAYQQNLSDEQNYLRATWGSFDGQWAYLLRNDRADEPMDRYGTGLRLQRAGETWRFGANFAHVKDRSDDRNRGTLDAYKQYVPAFDWEYRHPVFVLNGEHAYSNTTRSPLASDPVSSSGLAHKANLRASLGAVTIDGTLERANTDFSSLAGSATSDRMHGYLKADARIANVWGVFGIYDRYYNNLDARLAFRTTNVSEEVGVRRLRAFGRRSLSMSVSLRRRLTETTDDSTDRRSDQVKLRVADRYFDIVDVRADFENVYDRNYKTTPSAARNHNFSLAVSSRHQYGKWQINPGIEYGVQDNQNLALNGFDVSQFTRLNVNASNGAGIQAGGSYDYNSTNVRTVNGDARLNRAMLFWQTAPAWLNGGTLRFESSDNIYKFEDSSRDYREQIARVVIQWALERPVKKPQ